MQFRSVRPFFALLFAGTVLAGTLGCGAEPAARNTLPRRRSADAYVAMLEDPRRDAWQRPAELVERLRIRPGDRVADVGSGSGYFLPYLLEAVGPSGEVVAQDIDPELLERLRARIEERGWSRARTRLGTPADPGLAAGAFDLILMVSVYHHLSHPAAFLRRLRAALRPGGRLIVVDYPPGPSVPERVAGREHRADPARVRRQARAAGFRVVEELPELTHQFGLVLGRR